MKIKKYLVLFLIPGLVVSCSPFMKKETVTPTNHIEKTEIVLKSPVPSPSSSPVPTQTLPQLPEIRTIRGNLEKQIGRLEKEMPKEGSEEYQFPSPKNLEDFAALPVLIEDNDINQSVILASANNYELVEYIDAGDDDSVNDVLRELIPIQNGWGLFIFRRNSDSNIIIEAPHPIADEGTDILATKIYQELDAYALLIAGAHRLANENESADVAHAPQSIFQSVHETLVREINLASGTSIVVQIHGFDAAKHPGYPHVVIGQKNVSPELLQKLESTFSGEGVVLGICDGNTWTDLCGQVNKQANSMSSGMFVHIELDETMRSKYHSIIDALVATFNS